MNADAPNAATWRQLFASLSGDAAADVTVREFCETHEVTAAEVMAELHAHRRKNEPYVSRIGATEPP